MKTLFIADVHGRTAWRQMIDKENPDRVIFLGDYNDSYTIESIDQIHNFETIIRYKKEETEKEVILLIGNHDYHYMEGVRDHYSGYQAKVAVYYQNLFRVNMDLFQMAYQFENILCSHAGISPVWLKETGYTEGNICEYVNELWKYQPRWFDFNGYDPYGDDQTQGPFWIRPRSLLKAGKELKKTYIQIVGHTQVHYIDIKGKATGGRYYLVDTGNTEYLVYEDGVFSTNTL